MSISVCMMLRICPILVLKMSRRSLGSRLPRSRPPSLADVVFDHSYGQRNWRQLYLKNCEMSSAPWQVGNHFLKIELAPGSLFPAISGSMASTMRCRASGIPEILRAQPSSFMELLLRCYVSFCQWSISRQKNSGPIRRISEPISSGQCRVAQITKSQR